MGVKTSAVGEREATVEIKMGGGIFKHWAELMEKYWRTLGDPGQCA